MANEQNLRHFTSDQSHEEAVKNGRKGGKASGKKKQERKIFREAILAVLSEPLKDKNGNEHPSGMNVQEAMIRGVIGRAIKGDPRALEVIRDTIGEKPVQDVKVSTGDFFALDDAFKGMGKK